MSVNGQLTGRRVRRERELPEYAAMMRRMFRAYARRCGDADPEDLADMIAMRNELDQAIQAAVDGMRAQHGFSWADIARATGTTRQGAQQRWGRRRVAGAA